jgi:hypothetical protein
MSTKNVFVESFKVCLIIVMLSAAEAFFPLPIQPINGSTIQHVLQI